MLGNIALGRSDTLDDFLNADFLIAQDAENLESQRVRHSLERTRGSLDIFIVGNQGIQ